MRLVFDVLLRGAPSPTAAEQANKILGRTAGFFQGLRKFTYAVCLFSFTVRDEQAFFSWLAEPVVNEGGPKLIHHTQATCVAATDALLGEVIDRVVAWYGAAESVLIAGAGLPGTLTPNRHLHVPRRPNGVRRQEKRLE
jgi:hypothetical protein